MPAGFQGFGNVAGFVGSPFSPIAVPDMLAWFRADTGITLVSGRVSVWNDKSPQGDSNRNLLQGTAGARPLFNATDATYNNEPTVEADDTSRYMASGVWGTNYSQPITIYACGQSAGILLSGSIANRLEIGKASTYIYAGSLLNYVGKDLATKRVVCGVFNDPGTSAVYVDSLSAGATGAVGSQTLDRMGLLGTTSGAGIGLGRVAEAIYYSGAHDAATRERIITYLADRYAVTLS